MKPLSSVKKALKVLKTFVSDQPEMGVTEISRILKSNKTSIYKILFTLTSEGFLEKNPVNRKYRLGLTIVDLANRSLRGHDLREQASPFMQKLSEKTGEIIHLSVLDKNDIVYLDKKGEGQVLTVSTKIGGRTPAHASAMGKVLLSGLSSDEVTDCFRRAPLARLTPKTITNVSKLERELERIRKQGFAVDNEESFEGIQCVAAPILDLQGRTIAAISATVPKQRMSRKRIQEIRSLVMETARRISQQQGGRKS
jgi:IclR family transcriptional regulator, KDG regulon repressor